MKVDISSNMLEFHRINQVVVAGVRRRKMLLIILDFISNNWSAFVEHCKHHGLTDEDEIEKELSGLEKGVR